SAIRSASAFSGCRATRSSSSHVSELSDEPVYPHAADLALIPCELAPGRDRGSFELVPELCRFDGALYGGTGVAATVMAMEAATQRDALWVVTQFVASTRVGAQ